MKTKGKILLGVGLLLVVWLVFVYSSTLPQIEQFDLWRARAKETLGNDSDTVALAKQIYIDDRKVREILKEYDELNKKTKDSWSQGSPLLTAGCYLTTFSAPENVRSKKAFWPGIIEVSLLLGIGLVLIFMDKKLERDDYEKRYTSLNLTE